ncbi:MAG: xylulokinase [Actinomycetota bacterium]|nr:xylulokinase [Actinomycetota bacterium]
MTVLLGIDVGTTGVRVVAIEHGGGAVADASEKYPLATPRPGWAEQNPEDWWTATLGVLKAVVAEVDDEVAGIGLTGQMHGSVFLDEHDDVIRPALLWNDQRTEAQCDAITDRVGADRLIAIAGNPALTGFQAPKILWLRDEEPDHFGRVRRVLLPKDYVRFRLTGELATDASDASGTLLLDVGERTWSTEILEALDIPAAWLPEVREGPQETGHVAGDLARSLGLPTGVPVAAGGGDNAAAAVGTGVIDTGVMSSSIGTSGVLFAHTPEFTTDPSGRIHAFCHAVPDRYHVMGVTLSAGSSLRWWRHLLGGGVTYDELVEGAAEVLPGADGLVFLPYLSGERTPHLNPSARGAWFGLTSRHTRAHMTRALMEGVVFSLKDGLGIMEGLGISCGEVRATGGGARSTLWRSLQADIYDLPIRRTVAEEGPAFGAALLAGVAAGAYPDVADACSRITMRDEVDEPDPERSVAYREVYDIYKSLYPQTQHQMKRLTMQANLQAASAGA